MLAAAMWAEALLDSHKLPQVPASQDSAKLEEVVVDDDGSVPLIHGFYEISIVFKSPGIRGTAEMDVAWRFGTSSLERRFVKSNTLVGREAIVRTAFQHDTPSVEVRLFCNKDFVAQIEGVRITRLAMR